jgi:phosphatidylserine synthase
MYKYCKDMCAKCPACALANSTHSRAKELVYGFPISAPMMVLHADGYQAGADTTFEGDSIFLICACSMTAFAVIQPVKTKDSKGFASTLMRVLLHFGLCHILVIDKASAFFGVFREVIELLQLNYHVLSGKNHDAMLVE